MGGWGTGHLTGQEFRKAPTPVRTALFYLAFDVDEAASFPNPWDPTHLLLPPFHRWGNRTSEGHLGDEVLARTGATG